MKSAIIVAAATAVAGSAAALTQSQTLMFGPQAPQFSGALTFDQFNGNLADLTSIQISFEISVSGGEASLDNDGTTAASVDVDFGTELSLSSSDVSLIDLTFDPISGNVSVINSATINLDANDGDDISQFDAGGPDFDTLAGLTGTDADSAFINSAVWGDFVGSGTFDIDFEAATEFQIAGGSAVQGSFVNQIAQGTVTITYNFIPAPGTAALVGIAGLAAARRRR